LSTSVYISFIIISFGYMLPWTALGSLISYYKIKYNANFYLDIYIAYYIFGLPISILQYLYDDNLDRTYTSYRTYFYRGIICYSIMIIIILSLIWIHNRYVIVFLFSMLGKKQFSIYMYIFLCINLFIYLSIYICMYVYLSTYLFKSIYTILIFISINPFCCLSIHLFYITYLSTKV
jgi:hypothetical protein